MAEPDPDRPVLELRVALTARDYERLVKFYCDGLGLETTQVWPGDQGRAVILDMGRATLEVFDEKQAATIDQLEAGRRLSGQVRFALQVPWSACSRTVPSSSTRPSSLPGETKTPVSRTPRACR